MLYPLSYGGTPERLLGAGISLALAGAELVNPSDARLATFPGVALSGAFFSAAGHYHDGAGRVADDCLGG